MKGKISLFKKIMLWGVTALMVLTPGVVASIFTLVNRTNGKIKVGGKDRRYLLHVPKTYRPDRPTALVISIHGFAQWPAHQMQTSRWNELADECGFIIVYPMGVGFPLHWRVRSGEENEKALMEDVQFISDLIDELIMEYNIEPSRIYANGFSNGGGMTGVLACYLGDRIAAFGSVAGAYLYPIAECQSTRPMPLIAFHGTADAIVPFAGGESASFHIPFPTISEWIEMWARRNGCDGHPDEIPLSGEVVGLRYRSCEKNSEVEFYIIEGGGHAWPGGKPLPIWVVGHTTQQIDATRMMWEFFEQHPLY